MGLGNGVGCRSSPLYHHSVTHLEEIVPPTQGSEYLEVLLHRRGSFTSGHTKNIITF